MISRVRIEAVAESAAKVLEEIAEATESIISYAYIDNFQDGAKWVVTDDGVWAERFPQTHSTHANQLTGFFKGRRVITYQGGEDATQGRRSKSNERNEKAVRKEEG